MQQTHKQAELIGLLSLAKKPFSLEKQVLDMLSNIVNTEIEIRQPKSIKGVKTLLCAIRTYRL